jgi:pyruvate,water dikinase
MATERQTASGGVLPGETARSLFSKFRALLEANTAALATMTAMERVLSGEYVFDRTFLEQSAREVADYTHQAVYAVNAMTGNSQVDLYDRFMSVAAAVEDILAGRPGIDDDRLTRPLSRLRLEDRPKTGAAAALGELSAKLGLAVPKGFVVTEAAFARGRLTPAGRQAVTQALEDPGLAPGTPLVTVSLEPVSRDAAPDGPDFREVPARAQTVLAALDVLGTTLREAGGGGDAAVRLAAVVAASGENRRRGRLRTHWREGSGQARVRLEVWSEDAGAWGEAMVLDRSHPFAVRQGTALARETAGTLAGRAMAAERLLGAPLLLEWSLSPDGRIVFTAVHPLPANVAEPSGELAAEVLAAGGQAACLGAASGVVVHVGETTPVAEFPRGAVAVTRSASPVLAPLLARAGALVTEIGDPTGHLAAVAREYRTPALFGLAGARERIPQGELVTVDADAGAVLRGARETRLAAADGLSPDDPEYLTLRRLLRRIATLNLTDPEAPDFTVAGCHTLHDILHYAHVQAVAVLADLRRAGLSERLAVPLPLAVPLDLRVLDIGGGLCATGSGLEAVRSAPLKAFLAGMLAPGLWDTTPASVGLGDILGTMDKPMPTAAGGNLAIAAHGYCNVSLRLGYHFTVIDAYLGDNPEKNTIYFRFAGGLGSPTGRAARAQFMTRVLARHDFKATATGDLVVARLKRVDAAAGREALRLLGCLCAFSRQRDTGRPDAVALEQAFFALTRPGDPPGGGAS